MMRMVKAGLIVACVAAMWSRVPAQAAPTISPSVIGAARLKNAPPRGWIRHYLGDDRYKIAGKIWKFVSTERDKYFYPPWAPEMLRQSANTVIGFNSADDALEAGYAPSPKYRSQLLPDYLDRAEATTTTVNGMNMTVAGRKATKVTLSDGVSTIMLPSGYVHLRQSRSVASQSVTMDIVSSRKGKPSAVFVFMAGNSPAQPFLTPQAFEELKRHAEIGTMGNSTGAQLFRGSKITNGSVGGLKGVSVTFKPGAFPQAEQAMPNPMMMVAARGGKTYIVLRSSGDSGGANAVLRSFQPR